MCKFIFCDTLCFCKPVEMFKDFNTSFLLADGEIINQIKMTNLALADIKELLKQQVSIIFGGCHEEKMNLLLKAQSEVSCLSTDGVLQIKEIEFLKNTVMECEACGECDARGRQTLTHRLEKVDGLIPSVFRYGGDRAPPLLRAQPLPPGGGVFGDASGSAVWSVSWGHAGQR